MLRRNMTRGLLIALTLIVVPGLVLVGLQTYQVRARAPQLTHDREWVVHTFEVITTAQALATAVRDAERGQRRYLLSGESSYLEVYQNATSRANRSSRSAQRLSRYIRGGFDRSGTSQSEFRFLGRSVRVRVRQF